MDGRVEGTEYTIDGKEIDIYGVLQGQTVPIEVKQDMRAEILKN